MNDMRSESRGVKRQKRFCLVEGDIELLKLVYEYRFARIDNLVALTDRSYKKIHGRVFKLVKNGYLRRIILPLQKHIYSIGYHAVPLLVEQGSAPAELIGQRLRASELKDLFLKHELMIVDLHTMLRAATNASIQLVAWKEGPELIDRVVFAEGGHRTALPFRPDAFFTLESRQKSAEQNRMSFFLEADRSTTTHTRFRDKIVAYWNYLKQGLHTSRYGIRSFRVVTVALTPARTRSLCALTRSILPPAAFRYFLFGSIDSFSLTAPDSIIDAVFLTAADATGESRASLVPRRGLPCIARRIG